MYSVDAAQAAEKMNVTIASGQLPDFMLVSPTEFQRLLDADMLEDLTEAYEKYASPLLKDVLMSDGGLSITTAYQDGKLFGMPNGGVSTYDNVDMVWVRTDWLNKLNLPEPKTMDDVFAIIEAFVKEDPDGNGEDDTKGLALTSNLFDGYGSLMGFFNAYHAYPNTYIKDETGKLVFGSVQPEMKPALQKLQELYLAGYIDREFGVKNQQKAQEDTAAGKVGVTFGKMFLPLAIGMRENRKNDPEAEWKPYPIPSIDGETAKVVSGGVTVGGTSKYYVVRKGYEHPEAVVKLMNLYVEKAWGETAKDNAQYQYPNGVAVFKYAAAAASPVDKNLKAHLHVMEAMKNNDTSMLNVEEQGYYDSIQKYLNGDDSGWGNAHVFGEGGSYSIINEYANNNRIMPFEFYGSPTPTMVEKGSTLAKMQLETFTKIIMGDADVSEFDEFVKSYNSLGGEQIAAEVTEWAAQYKK